MLSRYIKFAFFFALGIRDFKSLVVAPSAAKVNINLPPECKGLDLIKGNPITAKTTFFGSALLRGAKGFEHLHNLDFSHFLDF